MPKNIRLDDTDDMEVREYQNISKIKTSNIGGGNQTWIPEDEYDQYLNRGTLTVTENGTYNPADEGYSSFSRVIVRIGDNSNYQKDVDGTESDPGYTYTDPTTGLDINPSTVPNNPIDNIKTNKYKGPGTITGVNPLTGEPTSVSTDINGNIQLNEIPDSIRVVTPPTITAYNEGETIDYTGIEVGAFKADGSPFPVENGSGEDGNIIPFDQLTFPRTIATTNAENENLPGETYPSQGTSSGSSGSGSTGTSSGSGSDDQETPEIG